MEDPEGPTSASMGKAPLAEKSLGSGGLLVLCGIDQFPESRSMVFSDAFPGDFSAAFTPAPFMLAVRVDIDGRV